MVLLCFERGACALRNNLGSYSSKHNLISTASSGRGDEGGSSPGNRLCAWVEHAGTSSTMKSRRARKRPVLGVQQCSGENRFCCTRIPCSNYLRGDSSRQATFAIVRDYVRGAFAQKILRLITSYAMTSAEGKQPPLPGIFTRWPFLPSLPAFPFRARIASYTSRCHPHSL